MAEVTFPVELGGDGNTYTDDANPNTGMAAGGHRARFVPALGQALAMAITAKEKAVEAAADRQQTGEDAQATAADRQQTGEDAVATAADRQQTGLDRDATSADAAATAAARQQTGLDRVATGEDAQATAADRQQTGLDRTATGEDAAATAADRQQTGLDRTATGEDAQATGADRQQTGIDRTASGESALEAKHWANYPVDSPVPEGNGSELSAKHWAEISRQRAVNAMVAQGAWDASTGALPAEPAGASYWLVTGAASGVTINGVEYRNKDMLLWTPGELSGDPGQWSKIDNTDSVASVAGKTGAVELVPGDVGADPSGTASTKVTEHEGKADPHTQYAKSASLGDAAGRNVGTVSGDVMAVGAFGVGLKSGDNPTPVDNIDRKDWPSGLTLYISGGTTGTLPNGFNVGMGMVLRGWGGLDNNSGDQTQVLIQRDDAVAAMHTRVLKSDGTWSPWNTAWNTGNFNQSVMQEWIAASQRGGVGTYAFMKNVSGSGHSPGTVVAASALRFSSSGLSESAANISGSWMALGNGLSGDATVYLRVS